MAKKEPAIIKRDSRRNWQKSKYIPAENVIVIMDNDDGTISLVVGDGETNVNYLPDLLRGGISNKAVVGDNVVLYKENMTIGDLATNLGINGAELIKILCNL